MTQEINEARFQKMRLDQLVTDGRFNRETSESAIRRITTDFEPRAFGVIQVWRVAEDRFVILDGQHRTKALRRIGYPTTAKCVPSMVHDGLTLDEAAELFVKLNASKLVHAADKYKALLTAGHTETCDIDRIVRSHGLKVKLSGGAERDGSIGAVMALRSLYAKGSPPGTILSMTLATLYKAWGSASDAYESNLLKGVGLYFHDHRDVDPDDLAAALVRGPGGAINLIGWAKQVAGVQRLGIADAIALTIEERVMKKRRSRPRLKEASA